MIKKIIYVFLKAKTQYNHKHYFKLGCYIYLLFSHSIIFLFIINLECYIGIHMRFRVDITYNHLSLTNTKTNDLNIKIRNKN